MNVILLWDYYDQVALHGGPYAHDEMRRMMLDAKRAGVGGLCFRVEGAGMAWVPSPSRTLFEQYDRDHRLPWADFSRLPEHLRRHDEREQAAKWFRETYAVCPDPLAAAVEVASDVGLPLHVYVCPFDQYWPGVRGTLVEQQPDQCIQSRDGKQRLAVPSMAHPTSRDWLLAYYDDVLAHDVGDVIVYPNSHAWYDYPVDAPDDWFGFEPPAVDDYKQRTGIDVRDEPFDIDDYYRHYGSYWTSLLEQLASRQRTRARRMIVGMDMGDWQVYLPWASPRVMTTWRHANDWRAWTGWGNVDVSAGFQVNMWQYDQWPANRLPYMPGSAARPPYQYLDEQFGDPASRDFGVWSFLTLHADRAAAELPLAFNESRRFGYDGLIIREAADFEFKLGWDGLAREIARNAAV